MGVVLHRAMIVSSWAGDLLETARDTAVKIFPRAVVSEIMPAGLNRHASFLIQTCGSKEGWDDATYHSRRLHEFNAYLNSLAHEDGSNSIEWVAVCYGNDLDERKPHVIEFAQSKDPSQ